MLVASVWTSLSTAPCSLAFSELGVGTIRPHVALSFAVKRAGFTGTQHPASALFHLHYTRQSWNFSGNECADVRQKQLLKVMTLGSYDFQSVDAMKPHIEVDYWTVSAR